MPHPTNKLERKKIGIKKARKMEKQLLAEKCLDKSVSSKIVGIWRKTRNFCSNPFCCGNPRRQRGTKSLTPQERLAIYTTDHWEDYYIDTVNK